MGYHKSQIEIGKMFENLGSNYYKNAIEWYTHAKLHRIISGYAHIGDIYFKQGYRENAEEQYKIAANKQDPYGQSRLGVYYRSLSSWGIYRVHDDYITAMVSLNKAAEQNYPYGQYELACMYENGCGTDVDKYQALTLYQKSKAGGYGPAGDRINDLNKQCYFHIPQKFCISLKIQQITSVKLNYQTPSFSGVLTIGESNSPHVIFRANEG